MWRSLFIALCLALSSPSQAASILVFGDSISAGYGLRADEAWPSLLQKRLTAAGYPHQVINASVSGETSAGGLARLPAALQQHKPDIVLLELGTNDGLRGQSLKTVQYNLETMIVASQQAGAKVVVIGMRLPPNYGPEYTEKFRNLFNVVAQARHTALVPFLLEGFADKPTMFQHDGIHPIASAQSTIVDTVWPVLKPLLEHASKP